MINNMDELIDEMKKLEMKYASSEEDRKEFQIYLPGISKESEDALKAHIGNLPESYLEVARKYNLLGVCEGIFCLWPGGIFETLEESIIDALNDSFFPKEFMEKHQMYQVGSRNTDLLCVTSGTEQYANGEVLLAEEGFDIYNPQDSQIHLMAKDFEQFLIILGNFYQVLGEVNDDDSNRGIKKQEFLERLKKLEVDEKYHKVWW